MGGLKGATAPFPEGLDVLGFCNGIDGASLQRYREAELTHGRVSMLATVGFLVGEQVEGSSFLFDAQVTGPAVNHFQQVPTPFWFAIGATTRSPNPRACKRAGISGSIRQALLAQGWLHAGRLELRPARPRPRQVRGRTR